MPVVLDLKNFKAIGEDNKILSTASFSVNSGDKLCIYGPSGSGKSILLSFINGVTFPQVDYSYDNFQISELPKTYLNFNQPTGDQEIDFESRNGLLLIDEPENQYSSTGLHQKLKQMTHPDTLIYVTHNLNFVELLSDKVLVLHYGAFKGLYTTEDFFNSKDPYISYIASMGC